jgi:hypothetical protein
MMNLTLAVLVIVLQIADVYLTLYGLRLGLKEGNPLMRNTKVMYGLKAGFAVIVIAIASSSHPHAVYYLFGMSVLAASVVAWNGYQIRRRTGGGG